MKTPVGTTSNIMRKGEMKGDLGELDSSKQGSHDSDPSPPFLPFERMGLFY